MTESPDTRTDCYGAELGPISESDGAIYASSLAFTGRSDLIATYAERRSEWHTAWRRYDAKALGEAVVRMARLERILAEEQWP